MNKQKILFLGSKPIGHFALNHLIKNAENLNCEVVGVLTNDNQRFDKNLSIVALSTESNIPIINDLDSIVEMSDIDYLISVQYHLILKKQHIDVARKLAINLHLAPLPEYRGCNQFSFAIAHGDTEFGTTLHKLEEGIDSGPIIAERRFSIPQGAYIKQLFDVTVEESKKLFEKQIGNVLNGNYNLTPQVDYRGKRKEGIYYRKDIQQLKQIDLPLE